MSTCKWFNSVAMSNFCQCFLLSGEYDHQAKWIRGPSCAVWFALKCSIKCGDTQNFFKRRSEVRL